MGWAVIGMGPLDEEGGLRFETFAITLFRVSVSGRPWSVWCVGEPVAVAL